MTRRAAVLGAVAALAIVPAAARADSPPTIPATVSGQAVGQSMPPGFVGVSMEYKAVHYYTGRDPLAIDPVLVALLRGLAPGQSPVLRIGGDSTDWTWWPVRGFIRPGGITYDLTKGWLRTTSALAQSAGAKLILGVNLATARPPLAAAEAQALVQGIGRQNVDALEVGNEPDLYGVFAWYRDRRGRVVFSRSRHYGFNGYMRDFSHWSAALPPLPLAGPSFAELTWMNGLSTFLAKERRVGIVTVHRYPLHGCTSDTSSPTYPTIPNLLADQSSSGLAQGVASYVQAAHARGLPFRVDEMNSVSCSGVDGVSNTFASALWALDTLFNMAQVGVDGVNVHTFPGAGYELFSVADSGGTWSAFVHPEYYGLMMFAQGFPPGARLLPVQVANGPVKVWATSAPDGHTRVVLINKDPTTTVTVQLTLPAGSAPATVQRLQAPSLSATDGVTFNGQSFGDSTTTGQLAGTATPESVGDLFGSYSVTVPAGSAALLTR